MARHAQSQRGGDEKSTRTGGFADDQFIYSGPQSDPKQYQLSGFDISEERQGLRRPLLTVRERPSIQLGSEDAQALLGGGDGARDIVLRMSSGDK